MVRLVFRPYTQVRRTICTSVSLRASTRVSSGFAPLRHSSPSFGSRQACSHSNPSRKIKVGRRCTRRGSRQSASLRLTGFPPIDSHTCQTPWSVFQDGPNGEPTGRCPERAGAEARREAHAAYHDRGHDVSTSASKARAWVAAPIRIGPRPESIGGPARRRSTSDRGASAAPIRFPPDNFKHSLTLFSKSFSSFPRGTCLLSVSRPYLALDGIYRPIGAAFPNNPTRRRRLVVRQGPDTTGLSPSMAPLSRELGPGPSLRTLLHTTIRAPTAPDFHGGHFPVRSPLLGESSLVSFPPLIDMLKLSGWPRLTWGRVIWMEGHRATRKGRLRTDARGAMYCRHRAPRSASLPCSFLGQPQRCATGGQLPRP